MTKLEILSIDGEKYAMLLCEDSEESSLDEPVDETVWYLSSKELDRIKPTMDPHQF